MDTVLGVLLVLIYGAFGMAMAIFAGASLWAAFTVSPWFLFAVPLFAALAVGGGFTALWMYKYNLVKEAI